jgi:DNA-binding NtrC family response regulator
MLDACDFPQIAAAMGVDTVQRQAYSAAPQASGMTQPALPEGSPFALNTTDAAGHIRRFEELESEIIRMAIARYEGHMSEVARRLGIGRSTLYRKLKEFGLEPQATGEVVADVESDGTALEEAIRKAG